MPLVAFVRHQIQPGKMQEAAERLNANGDRMAEQPGFVSRELICPVDGTEELATITVWNSREQYEAWLAVNRATNVHAGKESPYVGSGMTSLYAPYDSTAG